MGRSALEDYGAIIFSISSPSPLSLSQILRAVVQDEDLPEPAGAADSSADEDKSIMTIESGDDLAGEKFDVLVAAEVLELDLEVEKEEKQEEEKEDPMETLLDNLQNDEVNVEYSILASAEGQRKVTGAECRVSIARIVVPARKGSGAGPMHVFQAILLDLRYIKRYTMFASWDEASGVAQQCINAMVVADIQEPGLLMSEVRAGDEGDVFSGGNINVESTPEGASLPLHLPPAIAENEEESNESGGAAKSKDMEEMETTRGVLLTLIQCFKLQRLADDRRKKMLMLNVPRFKASTKKTKSRNPTWERRQTVLKEISKPMTTNSSKRRVSTKGLSLQKRIEIHAQTFLRPGEIVGVAQEFEEKDVNGYVCVGWVAKTIGPVTEPKVQEEGEGEGEVGGEGDGDGDGNRGGGGGEGGIEGQNEMEQGGIETKAKVVEEEEGEGKGQEGKGEEKEEKEGERQAFALAKVEEDRGRTFFARMPWGEAAALARGACGSSSDTWSSEELDRGGSMLAHLLDLLVLQKEIGGTDRRRLELVFSEDKAEEMRRRRERANRPKRKKGVRAKPKAAAGRVVTEKVVFAREGRRLGSARQGPLVASAVEREPSSEKDVALELVGAVLAAAVGRLAEGEEGE